MSSAARWRRQTLTQGTAHNLQCLAFVTHAGSQSSPKPTPSSASWAWEPKSHLLTFFTFCRNPSGPGASCSSLRPPELPSGMANFPGSAQQGKAEEPEQDPAGAARLWHGFGADLSLGHAQSHFLMGFPSPMWLWRSARRLQHPRTGVTSGAAPPAGPAVPGLHSGVQGAAQPLPASLPGIIWPHAAGRAPRHVPHGCHLTQPW